MRNQTRGWIAMALSASALFSLPERALAQKGDPETTLIDDVNRDGNQVEVEINKDVVYGKGSDQDLLLDLAAPKGLTHPAPAIVWIHGGAWRGGNKAEFEKLIVESARRGYAAVSINYRLVPKHIFPAQVEDSKCAVRWLRANSGRLHVDPNRIGAVGSSAGAHLAMMLGAMDSADGLEGNGGSPEMSSRVQAVVSYAGPTNLESTFPDASKKLVADFVGGPPPDSAATAHAASPVRYVSPKDPPMLLIQGTKDPLVPHDQAVQMVETLTKNSVPGRVELMIGEGHGWPKEQARVVRVTFEFLDKHLKESDRRQ